MTAFAAIDERLEKVVCSILMHEIGARNELLVRYPAFVEALNYRDAKKLAEICLSAPARVTPNIAESASVGHGWSWDLQSTYDLFSVEDARVFTVLVDRVLNLWKQRQLATYTGKLDALLTREVPNMDRLLAELSERVSGINRNLSSVGDPSAKARLERVEADIRSGKRLKLIPVGIQSVDSSIGGVDLQGRDYWVIEGAEKTGKTRFVLNMVSNLFYELKDELRCCWISTESAFTPEKLMSMLIAMNATRLAMWDGELALCLSSREYLSGLHLGQPIEQYVRQAVEEVSGWNLRVYGPGIKDGASRLISNALSIAAMEVDMRGANLIVLDNYQQLTLPPESLRGGEGNIHYRIMSEVVPRFSELVAQRGVAHFGISQIGRSGQTLGYSGLGYEANVLLGLERDKDEPVNSFKLVAKKVRDGPCFESHLSWEPTSGFIIGASGGKEI